VSGASAASNRSLGTAASFSQFSACFGEMPALCSVSAFELVPLVGINSSFGFGPGFAFSSLADSVPALRSARSARRAASRANRTAGAEAFRCADTVCRQPAAAPPRSRPMCSAKSCRSKLMEAVASGAPLCMQHKPNSYGDCDRRSPADNREHGQGAAASRLAAMRTPLSRKAKDAARRRWRQADTGASSTGGYPSSPRPGKRAKRGLQRQGRGILAAGRDRRLRLPVGGAVGGGGVGGWCICTSFWCICTCRDRGQLGIDSATSAARSSLAARSVVVESAGGPFGPSDCCFSFGFFSPVLVHLDRRHRRDYPRSDRGRLDGPPIS
jgi:hypothetical protein